MSTQTTPAPSTPATGSGRRAALARRIAGGGLAAATLAAVTLAVWPASEADNARADGERLGEAVAQLQAADSRSEADAALGEVHAAAAAAGDNAGDRVADQVSDQADALDRAVNGFVGYYTTDSDWDQALYEYELEVAVDDLATQAEDFRTEGPEVQQAFGEGYEEGLANG
jgi:hypothetical protein